MSHSNQPIRLLRRAIAVTSLGAAIALASPSAQVSAANQVSKDKGPLTGAESVRISISEKSGGTLSFMLPLPDNPDGDVYPRSRAEVQTGNGSCKVKVRRDNVDPGHVLHLDLECTRFTASFRVTDLSLDTTHFFKRRKATIAEFTHHDGSTTVVTAAVK